MSFAGLAGTNPPSDWLEGFVIVGEIQKAHGVHGEAKVKPETHDFDRYRDLKQVWLANPKTGHKVPSLVQKARTQDQGWLLKFQDFDTPESIKEIQFYVVLIPEDQRAKLEEGMFYLSDLPGINVIDDQGQILGKVIEVHDYPSVNVFEIKIKGKTVLAPWVADCIGEIDLKQKTVVLHIDFLFETYPFLKS